MVEPSMGEVCSSQSISGFTSFNVQILDDDIRDAVQSEASEDTSAGVGADDGLVASHVNNTARVDDTFNDDDRLPSALIASRS